MVLKLRNVFWLALAIVLAPGVSEAKPKAPRTVLDYFDLLPKDFFVGEWPDWNINRSRRKGLREGLNPKVSAERRSIIDLKNDYMRFPGGDMQGQLDIAIFRYKGQATVGVHNDYEQGDLSFWRFKNGKLVEVTKQVLPTDFDNRKGYILPRIGTAIRVFAKPNLRFRFKPGMKPLYTLRWRGGRFHRQK